MSEIMSDPAGVSPSSMPAIEALLRLFGQAWNNTTFYGAAHKITRQTLEEAYNGLGRLLEGRESLSFSVVDNSLLVDGQPVGSRNPQAAPFIRRLAMMSVGNFEMKGGMSRDEFMQFFEMLATPPERLKAEGGFIALCSRRGLAHVQARAASFQQIGDDEVVLKKNELLQGLALSVPGGDPHALEKLVAKLKAATGRGVGAADPPPSAETTPEQEASGMADGILASEEIRQAALTDGGATLAGAVAQTLQRCVEEICRLPEARTKQGRKRIAKMLQLLEKELMPRLAAMVKGRTKINLAPVAVAFAEMQEDLAVDSLAGDYMKKRSAMEATEKKILKFLKQNAERNTAAGEALRERLAAEGLTPEGWRVLQAAAARGQGKKRGGAGSGRVGGSALSEMLEGLDGLLRPQGLDAAERGRKVAEAAGKLGELMEATAAATEKKLDDLSRIADELSKEGDSLDPQQQRREMSRRRLMEVLAEVVQELFQPLTVITTTVQMLAARHLGEINGEQEAMLKLSGDAGERLAHLADRLRNICGNPEGRIPDAVILEKIYDG